MPIPAPAATSVSQCLLLTILKAPVPVATIYPEIPYQIDLSLYSCHKNSAHAKAVAVCPDGNELLELPSGLSILVNDFNDKTVADIMM